MQLSAPLTEAALDNALPELCRITSGSYTGDNTTNRAIPHGLGVTPKAVIIYDNNAFQFLILNGAGSVSALSATQDVKYTVTAPDETNFYVGNASDYPYSANYNASKWVAIG